MTQCTVKFINIYTLPKRQKYIHLQYIFTPLTKGKVDV